ncbi:MAG: TonB-dependent receptor [gamma proteobacterium endosymbiont of Lamellibrachia anaximandri]|nr:TonB-dependent receptor [gamma proteobacterium endosymbiont of Lamellibrachia anaximandri]
MNKTPVNLLLAGFTALCSIPGQAELVLPTLVVSASRSEQPTITTPASITIITRQEIQKYHARDLSEILRGRGGIQIDDLSGSGRNATIDMRGFGPTAGANTLILLNGRRLNNSSDRANPDLNSIDLQQVERIEIIQGSAGILFGNQAVGGVINIITQQSEGFQADVLAGAGNYHGYNIRAGIGDRLENGLSYQISADKQHNDNYRDNNETDRKALNLRLDYGYQSGNIFFEQQFLHDEEQLPGSLFQAELEQDRRQSAAAYKGDFSDSRTRVSRIGLRHEIDPSWRFEGEFTYRRNDRDFQTSFRAFPGSLSTQDRTVRGLNPRFIGTFPLSGGDLLITAGADYERTDYELITTFGPQILDQEVDAYYVQVVMPFSPAWSATAGVRHAAVENAISTGGDPENLDDSINVGSLGLVYQPTPAWRLFARADQNYRFATVDEHTNVVFGQPVGIKNQTGTSYEAGVEWNTPGLRAKLLAYRLDLDDEISFDTGGFVNTNLDKTRREGLILEGEWALNSSLTLGGSFTYTNPEITAGAFEGNRIPLVSTNSARLFSDWDFVPHWSLLAEALFADERVLGGDFANDFPTLGGYAVVNSVLSYAADHWHATLRANNLLDKAYSSSGAVGFDETFTSRDAYFPAPERNFWLTLAYHFQ